LAVGGKSFSNPRLLPVFALDRSSSVIIDGQELEALAREGLKDPEPRPSSRARADGDGPIILRWAALQPSCG
jgi:hypothetical protein